MSKKSKSVHKKHAHGIKHIEEEVEEIERDVHKLEKDVKLFAKFENIVFEIIIILIFGIALGALAGYMVGVTQPAVTESDGSLTATNVVVPVGLGEKIQDYVNTNLLNDPSVSVVITDANNAPSTVYAFGFEIQQDGTTVEAGTFYSTGDNLIIGTEFNLEETILDAANPNTQPSVELAKADVPTAELYVWGYCPAGIAALDSFVEAGVLLKDTANVGIVPFHDGHGAFELQQNKTMLAIQELYPEEFLNYFVEFYEDVYPICSVAKTIECDTEESTKLMIKAGLDPEAVFALAEEKGDVMFAEARAKATQYRISASPSLVVNGTSYGASYDRTADGVKSLVCSGYTTAPEACDNILSSNTQTVAGSC